MNNKMLQMFVPSMKSILVILSHSRALSGHVHIPKAHKNSNLSQLAQNGSQNSILPMHSPNFSICMVYLYKVEFWWPV
jgi:hypothetical protein